MPGKKTKGKRARELLARLVEAAHFDYELTAPMLVHIKYLLRNTHYIASIKGWGFHLEDNAPRIRNWDLPRFIMSQLEAQRLTKPDQPDIPVSPDLGLILLSTPHILTKETTTPCLFEWQCPRRHRTYFILAFLGKEIVDMTCQSYTVEELLQIRAIMEPLRIGERNLVEASVSGTGQANAEEQPANRRPDFKRPEAKPKTTTEANIAPKKAEESSSNSNGSEEIIYKGNPTRRGPQVDKVETEWKYRGRSGSEVTNEPLPAPAGVRAQQNEGFQRFYKAVVSPTHVRVTAGGRIVPNTRGASSPTVKRVKDKPIDAQSEAGQSTAQAQPDNAAATNGTGIPMLAVHPQFYAPYGSAMPHMNGAMPMMPMPMGLGMPGMFPYPHPAFNGAVNNAATNGEKAPKENLSKNDGEAQSQGASEEATTADKGESSAKTSTSEQLEQPKPFMFNGQLVYPMAPGFPGPMASPFMTPGLFGPHGYPMSPYPMTMMGAAPFGLNSVTPQMGGTGQIQSPRPAQASTVGTASTASTVKPVSNAKPTPAMPPSAPGAMLQPPSNPPISSIRPSEITKKQIENLRSSLKYHQDQLQYNKHQIDEKEVEKTIEMLSQQIQHFEGVRQMQLSIEEKTYPKRDVSKDGMAPGQTPSADENKVDLDSQGGSRHGSHREKRGLRYRPGYHGHVSQGLNTSQSNDAALRLGKLAFTEPEQVNEPIRKSSLPSGAALAPPFQPRGKSAFNTTPNLADGLPGIENSVSVVDRQLMPTGMDNWGGWLTSPANGFLDGPGSTEADQPTLGRPYLVGVLPDGINPSKARDADYVYGRELTDEELRARFLYWGRAPMSARQGLPKYDGKHFYPPSPVKADTNQDEQNTAAVGGTVPFAPVDPFRPVTPVNGVKAGKRLVSKENTPPKPTEDKSNNGQTRAKAVSEVVESVDKGTSEKAGNRIINNMLKRGITRSTDVLPSEVSATTAQGYLPQYTSYGTLAPPRDSTTGSSETPTDVSPSKSSDGGGVLCSPILRRAKAAAQPGGSSLEEQFRNIVSNDTKTRAGLPAHWKA